MSKNNKQAVPVSFTQNFLTSRATIERLLRLTNIGRHDTVVEIGAGKGHITRALLGTCACVMAYEIDTRLCGGIHARYPDNPKLKLENRDFLQCPLPPKTYKVFSNIPFAITTDIMKKLTQAKNPPRDAWLIMEKGAAKRFMGKPRDTLQSLLLKPFFDLRIIYHFRREDFHPMPRVDVVMLHIHQKEKPDFVQAHQKIYDDFVSHGLKHGLLGKGAWLTRRQISTALGRAGLDPIRHGGEVLYIQWLCLFRCWLGYREV